MTGSAARERALLSIRATLEDRREDPQIRHTMPREQGPEFNRYIALANGVLHVITPRALVMNYEVEALWLKFLLLGTHVSWGYDRTALLFNASLLATIPIPQPEYERQREETRHERLPLREIVELVQSADTEDSDKTARQAERDVRAAVKSGELPSRKRGRGFDVELGALFDWMGEPLEPRPDWGWNYEPVADGELDKNSLRVTAVRRMEEQREQGPSHPARVLPAVASYEAGLLQREELRPVDRLTRLLAEAIRAEIPARAAELAAIEAVAKEICDEFQDDGVIPAEVRRLLVGSRERLGELARLATELVGAIAITDEADENLLRELRKQVRADDQ